jgi:hypothetical protein
MSVGANQILSSAAEQQGNAKQPMVIGDFQPLLNHQK